MDLLICTPTYALRWTNFWWIVSTDLGNVSLTVQPSTVVVQATLVTVECTVDAFPAATEIRLTHDGRLINSQGIDISPNHLTYSFVASDDWTGQLTCSAINVIGNNKHAINLTVQGMIRFSSEVTWPYCYCLLKRHWLIPVPPAAPVVNLNQTVVFTHSVSYSWILGANGNSPITGIKVTCSDTKTQTRHTQSTSSILSTSAVLVGLIPGSTYNCLLVASNKVGDSTPSMFTVSTLAAGQKNVASIPGIVLMGSQAKACDPINTASGHEAMKMLLSS